jgi:hypothetical protein
VRIAIGFLVPVCSPRTGKNVIVYILPCICWINFISCLKKFHFCSSTFGNSRPRIKLWTNSTTRPGTSADSAAFRISFTAMFWEFLSKFLLTMLCSSCYDPFRLLRFKEPDHLLMLFIAQLRIFSVTLNTKNCHSEHLIPEICVWQFRKQRKVVSESGWKEEQNVLCRRITGGTEDCDAAEIILWNS